MALKSIIAVDVDDSKFQRFQTLFGRYQEQLAKTPGLWAKAGEKQSEIGSHFEKMAAAMLSVSQINRETGEDSEKQVKTLSLSEKLWTSIGRSTKDSAKNILGATEALIKWTGILGAVSGVVGFGGLWGIDRMAEHVANDRRSSSGLGLSIGSMKAFRQGPGRLLDADPFMEWVNSMELDVTKQAPAWSLLHHGLGSDTGENAVQLMDAIRSLARSRPLNQVGTLLHSSYGLDMSDESIRRLATTSDKEYGDIRKSFYDNRGALNIEDKTAKAWQDLVQQLEKASTQIYNTLVVALKPLTPALTHVSDALVKLFEHLGNSAVVKQAIEDFALWLNNFSEKVAGEKFLSAVDSFMSAASDMAAVMHFLAHPFDNTANAIGGGVNNLQSLFPHDDPHATENQKNLERMAGLINDNMGLPKGMLAAEAMMESHFDPMAVNKKSGAAGVMGFLPATSKAMGLDPFHARDAMEGAAQLDAQALARYHGDIAKALAAYNWGYGNDKDPRLDADIAAHGKDWLRYAPSETQSYVNRGLQYMGIRVENNTGGSATVTVNGLQH